MTELALTKEEVIRLGEILKTKEAVLRHRLQHYRGLHEIGEATEKQQTLMWEAQADYDLAIQIIAKANDLQGIYK